MTGAFAITGGTFNENGILRLPGAYGVRNTFAGGISLSSNTVGATVAPIFQSSDSIGGNITVNSVPGGIAYAGFGSTVNGFIDTTFRNADVFTGSFRLLNGRVTLENSLALGTGNLNIGDASGNAEKAYFQMQRGTATPAGTTLTIGPSTGYVSSLVTTTKGTFNSTVIVDSPTGAASGMAPVTATFGTVSNASAANAPSNVGSGYLVVPAVKSGGTPVPGVVAVVSGAIALRANDTNVVWGGNVVVDEVVAGAVSAATPVLSVAAERSLGIGSVVGGVSSGGLIGGSTAVTSLNTAANSRFITTATPGGVANSSNGYLILDGAVKDNINGAATNLKDQLRTEWVGTGSNLVAEQLNVWVNQPWNANGMVTLASGVMRFTGAAGLNFFTNAAPAFELSTNSPSSSGWGEINTNIGLLLTQPNQVFNIGGFTVHDGNTDVYGLAGATTGNITIGGENSSGTTFFGNAAGGTIILETTNVNQIRDLRLFANSGGTVDIRDAITQNLVGGAASSGSTGSLTKVGDGTVRLLGTGGAVGTATRVQAIGGTLELAGFETANTNRVASAAQLTMGGGTLKVTTPSTGTNIPTVSLTGAAVFRNGGSNIVLAGGNAGTVTVAGTTTTAASTATRNGGATIRFDAATTTTTGAGIYLNSTTTTAGFNRSAPLGWTAYGTSTDPASTNFVTGFAQIAPTTGLLSAYVVPTGTQSSGVVTTWNATALAYSNGGSGATGYSGTISGTTAVATSVQFSDSAANSGAINIAAGGILTVNEGVMVTSNDKGSANTIGGTGALRAGGTYGELILQNYSASPLTIGAQIVNNTSGNKGLIVTGTGTTILTNTANNFTGNVYLNGGTLQAASDFALGNAANSLYLEGGTLAVPASTNFTTARGMVLYGDRSTISVPATSTFTTSGTLNSEQSEVTNYSGSTNVYNGDLVINGGGTFVGTTSTNNSITGQLVVAGGSRLAYEGNGLGFFGTNLSNMDGTVVTAGSTLELRPTLSSLGSTASGITEFLHLNGAGQAANPGALRLTRASSGIGAMVDREAFWFGPITLDSSSTIFVDDQPDVVTTTGSGVSYITANSTGNVGTLDIYDSIFNGGSNTLVKSGAGVLKFVNSRIQNLSAVTVQNGELRFENGITGTIGTQTGAVAPTGASSFYTGTNNITVSTNGTSGTPVSGVNLLASPRLWFNDTRGFENVNITLNGGLLIATNADAPLQATSFNGGLTLIGTSAVNGFEVAPVPGGSKANPTVMLGAISGSGGFTKLGQDELQLAGSSSFTGELLDLPRRLRRLDSVGWLV